MYFSKKYFAAFLCMIIISIYTLADEPLQFIFNYENVEVYPYWIGEGYEVPDKHQGTIFEAVKIIDEEVPEIEILYKRFPWKRCQANLQDGLADGIVGSFKESRMEIGEYPMVNNVLDESLYLHTQSYCLYIHKDSEIEWNGVDFVNTENAMVCVPLGYSIIGFLKEKSLDVYEVRSTPIALMMLSKKRVDAVATLCLTAEAELGRLDIDKSKITKSPYPLETKKYYLILSKQFVSKYPELSQKIWKISREVGEKYYPKIAEKYINHNS